MLRDPLVIILLMICKLYYLLPIPGTSDQKGRVLLRIVCFVDCFAQNMAIWCGRTLVVIGDGFSDSEADCLACVKCDRIFVRCLHM